MKKLLIICGIIAGILQYTRSQVNLIKNPSFELKICDNNNKPMMYYGVPGWWNDTNRCYKDWFTRYPTAPEYFCPEFNSYTPTCLSYSVASTSAPKNYLGYQYPKHGNCYIGMILWDVQYHKSFGAKIKCGYTQILSSKLTDTLRKNHIYEFTLYWSLSDACSYATNQMQAYFTPTLTPIITNAMQAENVCMWYPKEYSSQVQFNASYFMNDTMNWVPLKGCFRAKGDECYVSILNARDTNDTQISTISGYTITCSDGTQSCYPLSIPYISYYIDDLSLYDRGYYGTDARVRSDTLICPNVPIVLGKNDTSDAHYQWYPSTFLDCDTCANPIATPSISTTYVVKKYLCDYATYDTVKIEVAPYPTPISIIKDTILCYPASVYLSHTDTAQSFTQYQWSPADNISCSDCPRPLFNAPDTGSYYYVLTQTFCNTRYHQDSVTIKVRVCNEEEEIEIPNVFTPNNDGVNDEWKLRWKCDRGINNFKVSVYNRWGSKVYESEDKRFKWDGRCMPDNKFEHLIDMESQCPTGIYYYVIEYEVNNLKREWKGYITLMR